MSSHLYAAYKPAEPYFDLVRRALGDLVDGEHFFDVVDDHTVYEVLYDLGGWPRIVRGRTALMGQFRGYVEAIKLHAAASAPSSISTSARSRTGGTTWTRSRRGMLCAPSGSTVRLAMKRSIASSVARRSASNASKVVVDGLCAGLDAPAAERFEVDAQLIGDRRPRPAFAPSAEREGDDPLLCRYRIPFAPPDLAAPERLPQHYRLRICHARTRARTKRHVMTGEGETLRWRTGGLNLRSQEDPSGADRDEHGARLARGVRPDPNGGGNSKT